MIFFHHTVGSHEVHGQNTAFHCCVAYISFYQSGLSVGLISAVLGMHLPGPGSIILTQSFRYVAPVYLGDTITASATVKEIIPAKRRIIVDTAVVNQDGNEVVVGETLLIYPEVATSEDSI